MPGCACVARSRALDMSSMWSLHWVMEGSLHWSLFFSNLFQTIALHTSTPPLLPNITAVLCWAQLGHSLLHCYTATQNEIYTFNHPPKFLSEIWPESIPAKRGGQLMCYIRRGLYTVTRHITLRGCWCGGETRESRPRHSIMMLIRILQEWWTLSTVQLQSELDMKYFQIKLNG